MRRICQNACSAADMTDSAITININGRSVSVGEGVSVAAALAMAGSAVTRLSVGGAARAPLCGMGVCQECRVTIDGRMHQLSCQTFCVDGMHVLTGAMECRP